MLFIINDISLINHVILFKRDNHFYCTIKNTWNERFDDYKTKAKPNKIEFLELEIRICSWIPKEKKCSSIKRYLKRIRVLEKKLPRLAISLEIGAPLASLYMKKILKKLQIDRHGFNFSSNISNIQNFN